jgi:3-hydroxybutyryl-CoA dehydrogenase
MSSGAIRHERIAGELHAEHQLQAVDSLSALAGCDLVVEAIVDVRTPNRPCLPTCETLLPGGTGHQHYIAVGYRAGRPAAAERFAGLHFFNPAPLMKVVEIVPGLRTDMAVCERLDALVRAMGHTPVRAQDTPGFIVNHAGRGTPPRPCASSRKAWPTAPRWTASLRERGRLQARAFELMDLTGLDVSHPVMESIYHQFYEEPRFRPSVTTAQRLAGGLWGRKTGEGFYRYTDGTAQQPAEPPRRRWTVLPPVWYRPRSAAPRSISCSRTWAQTSKPVPHRPLAPSSWWHRWALT